VHIGVRGGGRRARSGNLVGVLGAHSFAESPSAISEADSLERVSRVVERGGVSCKVPLLNAFKLEQWRWYSESVESKN
jgi:hypothetical protein